MHEIFKNKALQALFERDGYVILPLLNKEQIASCLKSYENFPRNPEIPFESSSFHPNIGDKIGLNQKLSAVFEEDIEKTFQNFKRLGTSFLTKASGENSIMPIHQDWSVVDESQYASITCWVPLQDTSEKNGAIQVIPGSHRFSNALRSPSLAVAFQDIYPNLHAYLKTLNLKAGEAFIFNHALMHASHTNLSGKDRVAVTYGLCHKDAQLKMYYTAGEEVEEYFMPDNMFIDYPSVREKPIIGVKERTFKYKVPTLDMPSLLKGMINYRKSKKMKALFKNKEHQQQFEKNGFVKVPILEAKEIQALINLHQELDLKDEIGYGFHVGMDNTDKTLVKYMVDTIKKIALPKVEEQLFETQLFTASFVIKEPNPTGVVPPHQDWSFVDNEEDYCSVTCWIPLQDVNMDNGCIGVIKGSNHFFDNHRPSPSPQVDTPLKEHMFTIFPFLELIEMKAGEALFFNNKTIHASPPNTSDSPRLAIGLGFTQKEAKISHYALKPGTTDTLLKYDIDADFFLKYDNAQLSKMFEEGKQIEGYELVEEVPYIIDKLDAETFTTLMQEAGNSYNASLVGKMAKLFNYNSDGSKKQDAKEEIEQEVHANQQITESSGSELPFWQVYTPLNILREIKLRITGK